MSSTILVIRFTLGSLRSVHNLCCTGQKRKQDSDGVLASLVEVNERAEELASQREEKIRRMELEMEEKMREREDRRKMQMFSMFTAVMQQMNSSASGPSHSPLYQPPNPYMPPFQPPTMLPFQPPTTLPFQSPTPDHPPPRPDHGLYEPPPQN